MTVGRVQQVVTEMDLKLPQQEHEVSFPGRYQPYSPRSAITRQVYQAPIKLSSSTWLAILGIFGTISFSSSDKQRFNAITLTLLLPWLFGRRAVTAHILLKWFESSPPSCQLVRGLLSVKYVVPDESRIMTACAKGDVPTVQYLLSSGKGSAHDMTRTGRTPLLVR